MFLRQATGEQIILVGLVIQIVFFVAFTVLAVYIDRTPKFGMHRLPNRSTIFTGLYVTIGCLLFRNIYRVVDKAVPIDNPFTTTEAVRASLLFYAQLFKSSRKVIFAGVFRRRDGAHS
jgi:chromate transport protein ChrA